MDKLTTIKLWITTRKKLRLIAALTDERIVEVMDRLATQELQRLGNEKHEQTNSTDGQSGQR